jgi:hypothetical protein
MPNFIKWEQYLADCGIEIKRSRADQLIRIAVGRTTVEQERADTAERVAKSRAGLPIHGAGIGGNAADPESSAEARKAVFAEADQPKVLRVLASAIPEDSTVRLQVVASAIPEDSPQPIGAELRRAEVAKLVRAWVAAAPEAKREFVRERWDEIAAARQQLDANGAAHEDRWVEGDAL